MIFAREKCILLFIIYIYLKKYIEYFIFTYYFVACD